MFSSSGSPRCRIHLIFMYVFFGGIILQAGAKEINAAGIIPQAELMQSYSSTGGSPQFKTDDQDLIYKIQPGDTLVFSVTAAGALGYRWQVMQGSEVLDSSNQGTTFNWTVPAENSTWKIAIEITSSNDIGRIIGRDYLSWSLTTADLITVSPAQSIQTAIDSLPGEGGIIELAAGKWSPNTTLTIDKSNVILRGTGKTQTEIEQIQDIIIILVRGPNATTPDPWTGPFPTPPNPAFIEHVIIEDMTLIGTRIGNESGTHAQLGVNVHEGWKIDINNVGVKNTLAHSLRFNYSYDLRIADNECDNAVSGIFLFRCHNGFIINNRVNAGGRFGIELNAGNYNFIIENNNVSKFTTLAGFYLYGARECEWRNNLVYSNRYGADVSPGAQNNLLENNIFRNNSRYGIWMRGQFYSGGHTFRGNLICNNGEGGMVTAFSAALKEPKHVVVESNTIAFNGGDGIYNDVPDYTFMIKNNIIVGNSGYGIRQTAGTVSSAYNDLWSNTAGDYAGVLETTEDQHEDPLFVNAAGQDFHLQSQGGRWNGSSWISDGTTSPGIDAGDPLASYAKEPLPNGGRINLGAYGNRAEASKTGTEVPEGGGEITPTSGETGKVQVFPNPYIKGQSHGESVVFSNLTHNSIVKIYTLGGKLVKTIKPGQISNGGQEEWNISGVASGMYIYYIETSQGKSRGKIAIIK